MKNNTQLNYKIVMSNKFKRQLKIIIKQGKNMNDIYTVIEKLSSKKKLESKYRNHLLVDTKYYKEFRKCHIEPDWLLIYKYDNENIILYLIVTGSYSDLFNM